MVHSGWRPRLARLTPAVVRRQVSTVRLRRMRAANATRTSEEVFTAVYRDAVWGEGEAFDSGSGSRGEPAERYASLIRSLVQDFGVRSAVDVGCGDFRVAKRFAGSLADYVGLDVVGPVVEQNNARYGRPGVSFARLDAARDELPDADLCLIRQVLQHLSNEQIAGVLGRCRKYPLVVVSEHRPRAAAGVRPNIDKPHGPDTRLDRNSWVDIRQEPFACDPVRELLCVPVDQPQYRAGESIVTMLWRPGA
jgi:SAM-dependent methyltransferase